MTGTPPINPLVISRSAVAHGILNPLCSSELLQIAINYCTHLTILDPKLPFIHEALVKASDAAASDRAFHCNAFFNVNTVVPWENTPDGGVGYNTKILLKDSETSFNFGRITEPTIMSHAWAPIEESSRDCFLGVLSSTGEFFILQRKTLDPGNYAVKHRLLVFLMEELRLPRNRFTLENDLILHAHEALYLRINAFQFGKLQDSTVIVCIAQENGRVAVYTVDEELKYIGAYTHVGPSIVQILWSLVNNAFIYVASDNSVFKGTVDPKSLSLKEFERIKDPSRFLVSKVEALGPHVLVIDTQALHLCGNGKVSSVRLPNWSTAVGLSTVTDEDGTFVVVIHEGAQCSVVKVSKSLELELLEEPKGWDSELSSIRSRYQSGFRKEQSKAISRAFAPYLDDNTGVDLKIHGSTPIINKYFVVAHSGLPANTINHVYVSLKSVTLSFLPIEMLIERAPRQRSQYSTFSYLMDTFLDSASSIPCIHKDVLDGTKQGVKSYLESIQAWKGLHFGSTLQFLPPIDTVVNLDEGLIELFRSEGKILAMQRRFCTNVSILKTLSSLPHNLESSIIVEDAKSQLNQEQSQIVSIIRERLASIIVRWALFNTSLVEAAEVDRFIVVSIALFAKSSVSYMSIPDDAKLTISTDLCTETFSITREDSVSSHIESESGHLWYRCDVSFIPILDLTNSTDELEIHSYLPQANESHILNSLSRCINYCIYTGTRKKLIV